MKTYVLRIILISALAIVSTIALIASERISCSSGAFIKNEKVELAESSSNAFSDYSYLSFDLDEDILVKLMSTANDITIKDFPVNENQKFEITLNRINSVIDCNTKFLTQTKMGEVRLPAPVVNFFEGTVNDIPGSKVYLTNIDGLIFGQIILSDSKTYIISPSNKEFGLKGNYVLVNQKYLSNKDFKQMNFGVSDEMQRSTLKNSLPTELALDWTKLLEFGLALETDSEFYKACGSDLKKAQAYAIAIINMVSVLYTREVNISVYLKWLKTWTDLPADPYDVKGNAYILSPKVHDYWLQNYKSVERDLAHVMTSISYGGGGFGYYNAICNQAGEYSFAVSSMQGNHNYPTVDFTYDVYTVAHEIGHNFNADHTHSCKYGYPLDTCVVEDAIAGGCLDQSIKARPNPGSIMSYCGGANNNAGLGWWVRMMFLPQSKNDIRTTALAAACMKAPANPIVILNTPQGKEQLKFGDTLQITWSASKINEVDISYTSDGGNSWSNIANNLDASLFKYNWKVPDICSNQMLIKIADTQVDTVQDIQKISFSIVKQDPNGLIAYYPFSGNVKDEQDCHFYNLTKTGTAFTYDRNGSQNSAVSFDGSSYLSSPFPFDMTDITLSFWFYAGDMSVKRNIIGSNYAEGWVTEVYLWGQLGVSYYVDGQGSPKQIWGGTPTLNMWHQGAFTWDGLTAKIYLDGKKVNESSDGKHILNKFPNTPLYIGSRKNTDYFKGMLDDIYVYRRSLSETEIKALYDTKTEDVSNEISDNSELIITPNPASNSINIITKNLADGRITIFDNLGNALIKAESSATELDISTLANGVYYLRYQATSRIIFTKLIVAR